MDKIEFHVGRAGTLRTNRTNWDSQWNEAAERLIPAHRNTFGTSGYGASMYNRGRKNADKMFDATAALALQRFGAVFESIATPQNQQWHRLTPGVPELRKNRQVRAFMDEVNSLLFRYRYRPVAGFVGQLQKMYYGYGAYGNGLVFTDRPADRPGLRYRSLHLGQTYVVENHQGVVDTFYRFFPLKPREIIAMFGKATPDKVLKAASSPNQAEQEYEILHCCYPRAEFDPRRRDSKGMPYASLYIFAEEKKLLSESGYNTFPLSMARYVQFGDETYGRGPAQLVLPAIKVLNEEKKTVIRQGHKALDPVLLTHDDGAVGTYSHRPGAVVGGGVNAQGRPMVHALPVGNIAVGKDLMDDERAVINDAFLITLFQILVETPAMTATEVLERAREKGMLLAPTAGRLQAEFLGPMIEREVDLLASQGLLPPPPPVLVEAGGEYTVEYDNPMARMARAENAAGFMRSLSTATEFFNITQDPAPLDWFNFDEAMPAIQEINGAPVTWTNTPETVAAIRAERKRKLEQQQAIEAAPAMAGMIKVAGADALK